MTNDREETKTGATKVTTPSDRESVSERVFDAPRESVFAAYTDPELIPQWATSLFHTPEERDGMLTSGMENGLTESHDRLAELLAKLGSG